MQLECVSPFSGTLPDGKEVEYAVGEIVHIDDEDGLYLQRCSAASFVVVEGPTAPTREVEEAAAEEDTESAGEDTEGQNRMERGGRKR